MTTFKNEEFFHVGNSKVRTVTIEIEVDEDANDLTILRNAREAVDFLAKSNGMIHKSWARKIVIV